MTTEVWDRAGAILAILRVEAAKDGPLTVARIGRHLSDDGRRCTAAQATYALRWLAEEGDVVRLSEQGRHPRWRIATEEERYARSAPRR